MEIGLLTLGDWLPDPTTGQRISQAERHRTLVESAVRAEAAGFDSVWLGEHHFCDYILSAPPVVLAAIAERTTTLRLGTGVTLLANLDPVRVAEDYATLDLVSEGRAELVVGRGILADTYARLFVRRSRGLNLYRFAFDRYMRPSVKQLTRHCRQMALEKGCKSNMSNEIEQRRLSQPEAHRVVY